MMKHGPRFTSLFADSSLQYIPDLHINYQAYTKQLVIKRYLSTRFPLELHYY